MQRTKITNSNKNYPISDKNMHYFCKRKKNASLIISNKTIKIMDCIF